MKIIKTVYAIANLLSLVILYSLIALNDWKVLGFYFLGLILATTIVVCKKVIEAN